METGATVNDVKKIDLPQIINAKGNLTFIEQNNHVPFNIKNVSWIYDVPGGEGLDGYSIRKSEQFIIALSGNINVVLSDGSEQREFLLNRSYVGLYVPPMIWRRIENFSTNSLTLVLSSSIDMESEYIRAFESFLLQKKNG